MFNPVSRLGDKCSGHGCFPPRNSTSGSADVFVNGIAVHRKSDTWAVHCCVVCHAGTLSAGSASVYANNLQVSRIGDPVDCGSTVAAGSPDVFSGD